MQTTIKSSVSFTGHGLHTGHPVCLTIRPASAEHGIWFKRADITPTSASLIPARYDVAEQSPLCTKLVNEQGVSVSTVEHVMAAVVGCGIHNALVEIDGPEAPILDGSAAPFVRGIMRRGVQALQAQVRAFEVRKTVEIQHGDAVARIAPSDTLKIEFHIDFDDTAIGRQSKVLNMSNGSFARERCDSRTFCRKADVEMMQANGLALGGAPGEIAVVFDGGRVVSPGGLRHSDEPVRHKMLDALGDLGLAGAPVIGHYTGLRAGHTTTNMLLRKLFATPDAVRMILCGEQQAQRLPGYGLHWEEIPQVA